MDIHGNSVARDGTLFVRLDDVDAVIDTLKAERSRSRPHTSTQLKGCEACKNTNCDYCDLMERPLPKLEEYAATIRNATLDEFMSAIEFRFDDTNQGRGVVGTIRGIKKSLRGEP
jgi:hypothetical protein